MYVNEYLQLKYNPVSSSLLEIAMTLIAISLEATLIDALYIMIAAQ